MQAALQDLADLLEGFVERDQDGVFVLECDDVQVLYAAKQLTGLDERDEADVVQVFCEPVATTVNAWLDDIVRHLEVQLAAVDERCAAAGAPTWPRLPIAARAGAPLDRVHAVIAWMHARLPPGDHRLVCALLPVEIHDRDGHGGLGESLLRGLLPAGVRLILRDDVRDPRFASVARTWSDDRVLAHRVTIDPGALVGAVADAAKDPRRAPRDRMLALLQLAFLDLGHNRLPVARQKFTAVAEYFRKTGDPGLQAFASGGAADVSSREGDLVRARREYDAALVLAAQAGALPVVLHLALAIAVLCRDQRQLADSETHYRLAALTAEKTVNPFARADALEQIGVLQLAQRRPVEATATWTAAAAICRESDYAIRLASLLEAQRELHRISGRHPEARACDAELVVLRSAQRGAFAS